MSSFVNTFFSWSGRAAVAAGLPGVSSPAANAGAAITEKSITARIAGKRGTTRVVLRMDAPPSLRPGSMSCRPDGCKRWNCAYPGVLAYESTGALALTPRGLRCPLSIDSLRESAQVNESAHVVWLSRAFLVWSDKLSHKLSPCTTQ